MLVGGKYRHKMLNKEVLRINTAKYGIYGFCVILSQQPLTFGEATMGKQKSTVRTIHYQDSAMVVGRSPFVLPPKRDDVLTHQLVIQKVMESHPTIPLSFGNVFLSEGDVVVVLKKLYEQIRELTPQFENKIEMGLKIFGKSDWLEKEIEADRGMADIKKVLDNMPSEAAYYERIRAGEMASHFFSRLQQQVIKNIFDPLSDMAEAAKLNEPVGDRALLNAAFLINKETEPLLDAKVSELYERWQDKMDFKYSGPWPVYNFVNIRLAVK